MRRAHTLALLALLGLAWGATQVHAGPPTPDEADADAEGLASDTRDTSGDEPLAPPLLDEGGGGFWLSVELIGPRGAQLEAAGSLVDPEVEVGLPRGGRPPPGELIGRVATLEQALAWIDRHAFGEPAVGFPAPGHVNERSAPIPAGGLHERYGVVTTALVVTAASELGGTREFPWPSVDQLPTPPGSDWRAAELLAPRVPLFAAPAATIPPASERFLELGTTSDVWLLGLLDRCDAAGTCTRWAQLVAREGDRFRAGWVPAIHALPFAAWVHDDATPGRPRRWALVESHREPGHVVFALLEREGELLRVTPHRVAHVGPGWPIAELVVLAGEPVVKIVP